MRFNIKLFNYKRLYIHFCFLALLNIFFSTENIQAKTFLINDIEISTPFEINFDKNEIIDKGFTQAFDRLILSKVHGNSAGKENLNYEKFNQLLKRVNSINTKDITKRGFTNKISLKVKNAKEKIRSNLELDKNLGKYCNVGKKLFFTSLI